MTWLFLLGIALIGLAIVLAVWRPWQGRRGDGVSAPHPNIPLPRFAALSRDLYWAVDRQGRIRFMNDAASALLGLVPDTWQGKPLVSLLEEDQRTTVEHDLRRIMDDAYQDEWQLRHRLPAGGQRILRHRVEPWRDQANRIIGAIGVADPLDSYPPREDGLASGDVLLDQLLAHLPVFYYRVDADARLREIRGHGATCLARDPQQLIGGSLYDLFPGMRDHIDRAIAGQDVEFESQGVSRDQLWWIACWLLPDPSGKAGAIGLALDVTEPKTAEVKMVGLIRENRALARRLVEVQEEERNLLSRELHDELGQSLTAVRTLAMAIAHAREGEVQELRELGSSIVDLSARLYDVVRNIMHRLRPDVLDGLGFRDALYTCIDNSRLEAMGIRLDVEIPVALDDLNDVVKISLYRIVQESLTNIAKYAMASHVTIRLHRESKALDAAAWPAQSGVADCVQLLITDDGVGLGGEAEGERAPDRRGSGMRGIRERVHALGGDINVDSSPGKGVRIDVRIDAAAIQPEASVGLSGM